MAQSAPRSPSKGSKETAKGASVRPLSLRDRFVAYLANQRTVARDTLRRLLAEPAATLMTVFVIGIALALPAVMLVSLANIEQLSRGWDGAARISLFLDKQLSDAQGQALSERLAQRQDVATVVFTSATEALEEFRLMSGYGEVLDALESNPLPGVIVVTPASALAEDSDRLRDALSRLPEVNQAKLDLEWVQRLYGMMEIGRRISLALGLLLCLGVLLVVGNTIKLAIEARRDEIVVVKLVGGTDSFVRRPFLYTGLWYGLGGGIAAWLILLVSLMVLAGPVGHLADLYDSEYKLSGLTLSDMVMLWITGAVLGWVGAWTVVGRHLQAIEPT